MRKYNMSNKFFPFTVFKPPMGEKMLTAADSFLSLLIKLQKSGKKINVKKFSVKKENGEDVQCLFYEPVGIPQNAPALVYCHGGGFVFRAAPHHYELAKAYALGAKCKVLMPDYALAPKNKYPKALEDCIDSYKWLYDNGESLGIDRQKIAVAGDSAGGCLAAQLSYIMKEKFNIIPCFQMLIYPVTDRLMNSQSNKVFTDTPVWNSELSKKMWKYYLGNTTEIPYSFPMEQKELSGLPDAYVELAEFDCLHDEGKEYAKRLADAGCKVEINEIGGTMHGFDGILNTEITKDCIKKRIEALKKGFI